MRMFFCVVLAALLCACTAKSNDVPEEQPFFGSGLVVVPEDLPDSAICDDNNVSLIDRGNYG